MSIESTREAEATRKVDGPFRTTHWTVVFAAAETQSPGAQAALEELCRAYWQPLYAFARRKGASPQDAEDLTQSFFASRVVSKVVLKDLDPAQGRFRTWLLNSFQNFIHNEWAKQNAQKRGGGAAHVSLDARDGEDNLIVEPGCEATPEEVYDRAWAVALVERAVARLRSTYEQNGDGRIYHELAAFLPGSTGTPGYAETALRLGLKEPALKMRVSRFKQEFGRLLQAEVNRTVSNAAEAQEELRYLISLQGGGAP